MPVATAVADPVEVSPGDPAGLSDDRLAAEISTLAGHIAAAMCHWLLLVAEFDRREAWGAWDCRSCVHWLSWRCGVGYRTAQEQLRVAHALTRLPLVRAHFAAGELSYSKVRAITRVAVEPYEEEFFVNFARHATAPMLEDAVSGYRRSGCLDDQAAADRHQGRRFRWWVEPDGMIAFEGRMAPEDAAVVTAAIGAATVPASKRSTARVWCVPDGAQGWIARRGLGGSDSAFRRPFGCSCSDLSTPGPRRAVQLEPVNSDLIGAWSRGPLAVLSSLTGPSRSVPRERKPL